MESGPGGGLPAGNGRTASGDGAHPRVASVREDAFGVDESEEGSEAGSDGEGEPLPEQPDLSQGTWEVRWRCAVSRAIPCM